MKKILLSTPFLAIMTCILWASTFVPTKIGLEYLSSPLQFAGYTYLIAGVVLMPWARIGPSYFSQVKKHFPLMVKVALFSTTILYGAYYMGQNYIDGSLASLIVSAQPFFVAVLAHFMVRGDRFTPLKVLSILMAVVGLVIVSYPGLEMMSLDRSEGTFIVLGVSLMLVNCISAAYGNIIVSKIDFSKVDIRVLNSAELALGGIFLLAIAALAGHWQPFPAESEFHLALLVKVFIAVATMVTWFALLARPEVKVSELNMWKFLIPVFGSIESWLMISGDNPNVYSVTGMIVLTLSLIIFYNRPLRDFIFGGKKDEEMKKDGTKA